MGTALIFWILMLLWLIFGFWWNWPGRVAPGPLGPYGPIGNTFLLFVLFLILGWHSFGAPIHFN